jgi:hypothetical protein
MQPVAAISMTLSLEPLIEKRDLKGSRLSYQLYPFQISGFMSWKLIWKPIGAFYSGMLL